MTRADSDSSRLVVPATGPCVGGCLVRLGSPRIQRTDRDALRGGQAGRGCHRYR
jgi:hypothetical protein